MEKACQKGMCVEEAGQEEVRSGVGADGNALRRWGIGGGGMRCREEQQET